MKITQISQQIKQQDRYSIYVDGKYAFSLSASALLESQLVRGQQLSEGELQNWKRQSSEDKISNQALRYAALRPHSRWEMQN